MEFNSSRLGDEPSVKTDSKVCEGGAGVHPQGGAEGGARVAVCEGNSRGSQPKDRASSVFPRYGTEAGKSSNIKDFPAFVFPRRSVVHLVVHLVLVVASGLDVK